MNNEFVKAMILATIKTIAYAGIVSTKEDAKVALVLHPSGEYVMGIVRAHLVVSVINQLKSIGEIFFENEYAITEKDRTRGYLALVKNTTDEMEEKGEIEMIRYPSQLWVVAK